MEAEQPQTPQAVAEALQLPAEQQQAPQAVEALQLAAEQQARQKDSYLSVAVKVVTPIPIAASSDLTKLTDRLKK